MRIFFLSSLPPIPTWGTSMAFHRHFVEREGFQVFVATDNPQIHQFFVTFPFLFFETSPFLRRLQRTRFGNWFHAFQHFLSGKSIPKDVFKAAKDFKPDLVLTVAGTWSWTAEMASQLAAELDVPLVVSFNDWFDYNLLLPSSLNAHLERRFRRIYRQSALALCTSEGMRDALGPHPNALVLYPIGAPIREQQASHLPKKPARVLFGGNMGEWYGKMLEALISSARESGVLNKEMEFTLFGSNPSWTPEFDQFIRESAAFHGQVPFERLCQEANQADILLLIMGFGDENGRVERTSFKTKYLDYLSFTRPILVWGPDYSTAVIVSKEFDSAEVCTSASSEDCLSVLRDLIRNQQRQQSLVENSRRMYDSRFHPDKIHDLFRSSCQRLLNKRREPS